MGPWMVFFCIALLALGAGIGAQPAQRGPFLVTGQISPVPAGKGWPQGVKTPTKQQLIDTVDAMIEHGFNALYHPTGIPVSAEVMQEVLDHALSRGMVITWSMHGLEMLDRNTAPDPTAYSPEYARKIRASAEQRLKPVQEASAVHSMFTYMDEPFHAVPEVFSYAPEVRAEFRTRYGYDLPDDLESARLDPKVWLDVINFRSAHFPDAWRQVYPIVKELLPGVKTILTHDSHSTFGGGVRSDQRIGVDDVFHWGGDASDIYVFDIYPYHFLDYRYGKAGYVRKPRTSQLIYGLAHMRNLTRHYNKEMGFWFGTWNEAWFKQFLTEENRKEYWGARECATTAVAHGADLLISGYLIPQDARHWESLGAGLRLIQKAAVDLPQTPKLPATACFLFPRTQYVQLQQEYWNVGQAFELFRRAYGELDLIHEDQITDDTLLGYKALVLLDVSLLPESVMRHIASWVRKGGVLITDCVPRMDAVKQRTPVMEQLCGVKDALTARVEREGQMVPYADKPVFRDMARPDQVETAITTLVRGTALGRRFDFTAASPRPCTVHSADVLLRTVTGQPALISRTEGKGRVYLLGFCLQDSYLESWLNDDARSRTQLLTLLRAITGHAGLRPQVWSSNPDVEATLRASTERGYLFLINHEAVDGRASVALNDLPFRVSRITDMENDTPVRFRYNAMGGITLTADVPFGSTAIYRLGMQ